MEPVYFHGENITYEKSPKRLYCVALDHKGEKCKYRATHRDTQKCGFHHEHNNDNIVIPIKPFTVGGDPVHCFPMKEYKYQLSPRWLMNIKKS
jgi:hypothetical protein